MLVKTDHKLSALIDDPDFMPVIVKSTEIYPRYDGEDVAETVRKLYAIVPDVTIAGMINFFSRSCANADARERELELWAAAKRAVDRAATSEALLGRFPAGHELQEINPAQSAESIPAPVGVKSPAPSGHSVAPGIEEGVRQGSVTPSSPHVTKPNPFLHLKSRIK
jgi:hypothetical protein